MAEKHIAAFDTYTVVVDDPVKGHFARYTTEGTNRLTVAKYTLLDIPPSPTAVCDCDRNYGWQSQCECRNADYMACSFCMSGDPDNPPTGVHQPSCPQLPYGLTIKKINEFYADLKGNTKKLNNMHTMFT